MGMGLPAISSALASDVRQFLSRVREILSKDGLVTAAELTRSGIASTDPVTGGLIPGTGVVDSSTPPAPTGLAATGALANIMLSWDAPTYHNHAYAEIWRAGTNDLGAAVLLAMLAGRTTSYVDNVGAAATEYYWIRFVSTANVRGPFNATSGTEGQTGMDPAYVLSVLAGQVGASELTSALSSRIDLIDGATGLTGSVNARILDEATTRAADILAEAGTRATQDSILSESIYSLSAGSGEQFDYDSIWYFDTTVEGWTGNGTPTQSAGWLRPANDASAPYGISPASLGVDAVKYSQTRMRVKKTGTLTWRGYIWWKRAGDSTWDSSRRVTATEPSYDGSGIGLVSVFPGWDGTIDQIRVELYTTQDGTNYATYDWIAIGRPSPGASAAALAEEIQARADGDSAEASARDTLATQMRGSYTGTDIASLTTGLIYTEREARSTADSAEASARTALAATVSSNYTTLSGSITSEASTRASADSALSTSISSLSATVSGNYSTLSGMVTSEASTRASADSALSSSISTLSATVSSNNSTLTAAVSTEATARAGADGDLQAQYTVKVDVNGRVAGFGLASTLHDATPLSEFTVIADRFAVVKPSDTGGAPTVPFVIGTVDGATVVAISNAFIQDAAITNEKVGGLNADKINAGYIDAARLDVATAYITNEAQIANATVNTLQVAGNAITAPASAYTDDYFTFTDRAEHVVQSVTLDALGSVPVFVIATMVVINDATQPVRILRDGTEIEQLFISSGPYTVEDTKTFAYTDTPDAGVHTYDVVMSRVGSLTVAKRSMFAVEVRR